MSPGHSTIFRPPLAPADRYLCAQSIILLTGAAWAGGGWMPGAPAAIAIGAILGLPAIWLRRYEDERPRLLPLLPALLWCALEFAGFANPSHFRTENGAWLPDPHWISWLPTTTDPQRGFAAGLPWVAALIQGGVIRSVRPHRRVVRLIWSAAALNGFALAVVGAAFHFAQADKVLGFVLPPEPTYFFATFFYKNHWATYGALCAAAGIALALRVRSRTVNGDPGARGQLLLFSVAALLTLVTLPLPGSRTGAILAFVLVVAWLAGLARGFVRRNYAAPVMLIALGLVIVAYGINSYLPRAQLDLARTEQQLRQVQRDGPVDLRLQLSRDTWRMAAARPWFGWGIGSFETVFPLFQGEYLRDNHGRPEARFEFAHNDWLQMAGETGLAGLLVLLSPVAILVQRSWHAGGIAGRHGLIACGFISAVACFDFPLNNPAVLLMWTTLLVTAEFMEAGSAARGVIASKVEAARYGAGGAGRPA